MRHIDEYNTEIMKQRSNPQYIPRALAFWDYRLLVQDAITDRLNSGERLEGLKLGDLMKDIMTFTRGSANPTTVSTLLKSELERLKKQPMPGITEEEAIQRLEAEEVPIGPLWQWRYYEQCRMRTDKLLETKGDVEKVQQIMRMYRKRYIALRKECAALRHKLSTCNPK